MDAQVPTRISEAQLDEIMGFLRPGPGEISLFELSFVEREKERQREK